MFCTQARSTKFTDERQSRMVTVHVGSWQCIERVMLSAVIQPHIASSATSSEPLFTSTPTNRTVRRYTRNKSGGRVRFVDGWSRMHLIEPRLDAVTCDARSIHDRAREMISDGSLLSTCASATEVADHCSRRGLRVGMVRHRRPSKRWGGGGMMSHHDPNTKFTRGRQSRVVR